MDSDSHGPGAEPPDGSGVDPDPPLYKFGTFDQRIGSLAHSVGVVIAAFAVGIVLSLIVFSMLASALGIQDTENVPAWVNAAGTAVQFIGFFIVGLLYIRWRTDDRDLFAINVPSLRDIGWIVLGYIILMVSLFIVSIILSSLNISTAENVAITQGEGQPIFFLYLVPIAFLLNGPAEELLFRGLVQGLFRRAYGILPGVAAASLFFGFVHIVALLPNNPSTVSLVSTLIIISVLGAILGLLYERTKNLIVPMAVHGLFNAIQFGLLYLRVTGQVPTGG